MTCLYLELGGGGVVLHCPYSWKYLCTCELTLHIPCRLCIILLPIDYSPIECVVCC